MCLVNKILIGLIIVATAVCFYFSAITLKTHSFWRGKVNKDRTQLAEVQKQVHAYQFGSGSPSGEDFKPSVRYLRKKLSRMQAFRGNHAWFNCPAAPSADGSANVTLEGVNELILPAGTRVYAFEESDDGITAKYMGMFFVKSCDAGDVALTPDPVLVKNPAQLKAISNSVGNWTIYTIMPGDSHEVFKGMEEDELAEMLPKESLEEYVRDGEKDEKTGTKFERPLRAYDILFEMNMVQSILLNDLIMVEASDMLSAQDNEKLAQEQEEILKKINDALTLEKERYTTELEAISGHNATVSQRLTSLESKKQSYLKDINSKAEAIAKRDIQWYKNSPPVGR
ncbi:MAG: hypothetical protein Q4D98_12495 [Planctomycetia bacterium]|nr:hypothetical protein [Planctomycetia bacterium]